MLLCPMCKKALDGLVRECPRCRADLTLLADHVGLLQNGLDRADALTRQGALGEAVWAYLEVLEVDPDNPMARQQVGRVATAVRQFDHAVPDRRWLQKLRRRALVRNWLYGGYRDWNWFAIVGIVLLALTVFGIGFQVGQLAASRPAGVESAETTQAP